MSKWIGRMERGIALALAVLIAAPVVEAGNTTLPSAPQPQAVQTGDQTADPAGQSAQNQQPAQTADTQQQNQKQPVGTAVAPVVKPEGVAASRPAGAAIAPAKQRRVRSFAIRVGLLVAAGVAIGTVAAASLGSPARPH